MAESQNLGAKGHWAGMARPWNLCVLAWALLSASVLRSVTKMQSADWPVDLGTPVDIASALLIASPVAGCLGLASLALTVLREGAVTPRSGGAVLCLTVYGALVGLVVYLMLHVEA